MDVIEDPGVRHVHSVRIKEDAVKLIRRRHAEYGAVSTLCHWILDTMEGGERYKRARYDSPWADGPIGNLIRHRREWPISRQGDPVDDPDLVAFGGLVNPNDPAARVLDMYNRAATANYEVRLARTPTPTKLRQVIDKHLSQIFKQSCRRRILGLAEDTTAVPGTAVVAPLADWWADVDGRQTSMDEWMRETVGPILVALGMIDVYCDHPTIGDDTAIIASEADVVAADLKKCHAQYILPQNILWYRLDYTHKYYVECLVLEQHAAFDERQQEYYVEKVRHWTREGWTLYEMDGEIAGEGVNNFRRVPIVRCFDRRHMRVEHAGDPRFFGVVEKSREYYNEESELIYAMDLQCFALLQSPPLTTDDAGEEIPTGPGMTLFKQSDEKGNVIGYEFLTPPTSPFMFMMDRLRWLEDQMDADAGLVRPATAVGDGKSPQPASGISKAFDQEEGSNILAGISMTFQAAEYSIAELATTVLNDDPPTVDDLNAIEIIYPTQFNLLTYQQVATMVESYVFARDNFGFIVPLEEYIIRWMGEYVVRSVDPERRQTINDAIAAYLSERSKRIEAGTAAAVAPVIPPGANGQAVVPADTGA